MTNFKETVQNMTIKEIILAMVNGLKKEHVKVSMSTFGSSFLGTCYGCAATNTICEISGVKLHADTIHNVSTRWESLGQENIRFLDDFENAINALRLTNFTEYNDFAVGLEIAKIDVTVELPPLRNDNYKENIKKWEEYANSL